MWSCRAFSRSTLDSSASMRSWTVLTAFRANTRSLFRFLFGPPPFGVFEVGVEYGTIGNILVREGGLLCVRPVRVRALQICAWSAARGARRRGGGTHRFLRVSTESAACGTRRMEHGARGAAREARRVGRGAWSAARGSHRRGGGTHHLFCDSAKSGVNQSNLLRRFNFFV